jgi:hypothetical protein
MQYEGLRRERSGWQSDEVKPSRAEEQSGTTGTVRDDGGLRGRGKAADAAHQFSRSHRRLKFVRAADPPATSNVKRAASVSIAWVPAAIRAIWLAW